MAQEILLQPGLTAAKSIIFTVGPGMTATLGVYSSLPSDKAIIPAFPVLLATPGVENRADYLSSEKRQVVVGPGTYRVQRFEYKGVPFGVFVER